MRTSRKRVIVCFDSAVHKALQHKSTKLDRSVSDLVNDAVRVSLGEDAKDLDAFEKRAIEPSIPFERFVRALRRRGRL